MFELRIPLKDIYLDLRHDSDLAALPEEQAIMELANAYSFLGRPLAVAIDNDHAVITAQVGKPHLAGEAAKAFQRGNEAAQRGNYERAIQMYKQVLDISPESVDARRNLAMAYLELKQVAKAESHLLEALRLDPQDGWSNLLAGNILAGRERDFDAAMTWYRRAYEVSPQDPILLTNLGATLKQQGHVAEAADYFARAIAANPKYPNSYYAAAVLKLEANDPEAALSQIDALFSEAEPVDVRSNPLMVEARKLWAQANQEVAAARYDALMQAVRARQTELGETTGQRIEVVEDNSLEFVSAVSQLAWKYHRDYHLIKYRRKNPVVLPSILFHELQHIALVDAARKAGRNRYFAMSDATRDYGQRALQDDVKRLQDTGLRADDIRQTVQYWVNGLTNQLFNIPLDMVIERALFEQYPALRPSQFVSLRDQHLENLVVITDPSMKRLTPARIYKPNVALSCAYALFMDFLYQGRTDYAAPYRSTNVFAAGERLFKIWQDSLGVLEAGDEYILVDEFARELRLQEWYEWVSDAELAWSDPDRPEGSTNPELLRSKDPASMWHLLAALEHFDGMPLAQVREITFEIALLGVTGLDYASAEAKYSVRSLSDEQKYTGLQLMCYMYVGFKIIDPSLNSGIDLDEPYQLALQLFQPKHPREDD